MLRRYSQQTYVPTKKDPIASLQPTYINLPLPQPLAACAHHSEPTPTLELSTPELDGRWLQVPAAKRWELLLPPAQSAKTPDPPQRHAAQ
jgi:hypothetical protein